MGNISDCYSVRRLLTENFEINFSDWCKAITEITGSQLKYEVNRILIPKINNRVIDFNLLEKQKKDDSLINQKEQKISRILQLFKGELNIFSELSLKWSEGEL